VPAFFLKQYDLIEIGIVRQYIPAPWRNDTRDKRSGMRKAHIPDDSRRKNNVSQPIDGEYHDPAIYHNRSGRPRDASAGYLCLFSLMKL
jgi:hypothetical protein